MWRLFGVDTPPQPVYDTPMTRHRFLAFALTLLLTLGGCGYPKQIDPPIVLQPNPLMARLAAEAEVNQINGDGGKAMVLPIVGTSRSMADKIRPGDFAVLDLAAPYGERVEGEVIAYEATGPDWVGAKIEATWVVHRIVLKDKDGLLLSGDGNPRSEARSRVTAATYHGLVKRVYRPKS